MNGKSGNMNNVLQQIYPTGCFIPPDELIAVFDADQVSIELGCSTALLRHGHRIPARLVDSGTHMPCLLIASLTAVNTRLATPVDSRAAGGQAGLLPEADAAL